MRVAAVAISLALGLALVAVTRIPNNRSQLYPISRIAPEVCTGEGHVVSARTEGKDEIRVRCSDGVYVFLAR